MNPLKTLCLLVMRAGAHLRPDSPVVFVLHLLSLWVAITFTSCQKGALDAANQQASQVDSSKDEPLSQNEIIWAGLSGNPPRFIDSGTEKGMGYFELETKLIRKVLAQSGFKIRYEYFSSARIAHEFSRKSPICFYPFEWNDPQKVFSSPPDRIYSIPLDFKGDEVLSIIIRKEDEKRFKKFVDSKGMIQLGVLLKDSSLKTLLPKTEGLGDEFKEVYRTGQDGSTEINPAYKKQVSTRVIRDNHQLLQMLEGGRFDYLLDTFVIQDDYRSIKLGKTPFISLPYAGNTIQTLTDPRVRLVSVACGLHERSMQAMPIINSIIQAVRGTDWDVRRAYLREQFEPTIGVVETGTITSRFASEVASGGGDTWYSLQQRHFQKLAKFPADRQKVPQPGHANSSLSKTSARDVSWWLVSPTPDEVWILPKADAIFLATAPKPSASYSQLHGPANIAGEQLDAWSPRQIDMLRKVLTGEVLSHEGSFPELFDRVIARAQRLRSFSLLARCLAPEESRKIAPLLTSAKLSKLEVVFAGPETIKEVFSVLPEGLTQLNLFGSILTDVPLSQVFKRLVNLTSLNIGATLLDSKEFQNTLFELPSGIVNFQAAFHPRSWTVEVASRFGKRSLPQLEVLDLTENNLDDRHCSLFNAVPSPLRELKLNYNQLTSKCLGSLFQKTFPNLHLLEMARMTVSTKENSLFKIPPSVKKIDLSISLTDQAVAHLQLPPKLESLSLVGSYFGIKAFSSIAKHLAPRMDLLDLTNSNWGSDLHFALFKELESSGVKAIKDLRVANVNFSTIDVPAEIIRESFKQSIKSLRVESAHFKNTRLSNDLLGEIASNWGSELQAINLSQNPISSHAVLDLLKKSPRLHSLDLSDLPDLDLEQISPQLPPGLRSLNIAGSGITGPDLEALLPRLPKTLTSLDLSESIFEKATGELMRDYLRTRANHLTSFTLKFPLSKIDWNLLLPSLPPNLKFLSFGPAELNAEETSSFLSRIPWTLDGLSLQSVRLNVNHSSEMVTRLPLGLSSLHFFANSSLSERSPDHSTPPSLPRLLRVLRLNTERHLTLAPLIGSVPQSTVQIILGNQLSAPLLRQALDRGVSPFLLEISGTTIDSPMMNHFNRMRLETLQILNCAFLKGSTAQLKPESLEDIKTLNLTGSNLSSRDIIALLKALPPNMIVINLSSTPIKYSDLDRLIRALPKGLQILYVKGTEIGPKGYEKLLQYAEDVEKETGLRTWVIY